MTGNNAVGAPRRGVRETVEIGRANTNNFSKPVNIVKNFKLMMFAKLLRTTVKTIKPKTICSHV
jgi:hypothetical protein